MLSTSKAKFDFCFHKIHLTIELNVTFTQMPNESKDKSQITTTSITHVCLN